MLNTELATWRYPLAVDDEADFVNKTTGMSDEEYDAFVQDRLNKYESELKDDKRVGEAYKEYVLANWEVNALVLQGTRGTMPEEVDSPYVRYSSDYMTYLQYLERDKGEMQDVWEDMKKARSIYRNTVKEERMSSDDRKALNLIGQSEIRTYVKEKMQAMQALSERAKASKDTLLLNWIPWLLEPTSYLPLFPSIGEVPFLLISGLHGVDRVVKVCRLFVC